jgi:hypothetical protein
MDLTTFILKHGLEYSDPIPDSVPWKTGSNVPVCVCVCVCACLGVKLNSITNGVIP